MSVCANIAAWPKTKYQCIFKASIRVIVRVVTLTITLYPECRMLNVCLRLPPAGIELRVGSCTVVILATTTRVEIAISHIVIWYKTCVLTHLSGHVCCCLSMF
jgi:hypothetical protein